MYATRFAAGTAVAAALLATTAPAAIANDGHPVPSVHATPGNVHPGQTVQLTLTCPTEAAAVADGTSKAGTILFGTATKGVFTGTLQVHATTPAGQYTVTASCSSGPPTGKPVTTTTTVVVATTTTTTTTTPVTGPVHTGFGGAAGGPDNTQIAIGTLLAAGALGTATLMLRRRAANRT
ncbi:hypothetical protein [Yinghuangia sp. YIM S09857]|uniref:hypothetical protein n=1 Tax=Yinghuangia sp. YIM S09857 TaxID=3436929 RepID=UPI003F52C2E0